MPLCSPHGRLDTLLELRGRQTLQDKHPTRKVFEQETRIGTGKTRRRLVVLIMDDGFSAASFSIRGMFEYCRAQWLGRLRLDPFPMHTRPTLRPYTSSEIIILVPHTTHHPRTARIVRAQRSTVEEPYSPFQILLTRQVDEST
jgi:hypothetical protein